MELVHLISLGKIYSDQLENCKYTNTTIIFNFERVRDELGWLTRLLNWIEADSTL